MKPRLLDAFCGAGGCTAGYQRAGFYVVGVDVKPQPNYCGDEFMEGDALEILRNLVDGGWEMSDEGGRWELSGFDAVHASPPCQAYTSIRALGKGAGVGAEDLIGPTRAGLEATGLPFVIENVPGSPLRDAVLVCGSSVGLRVRRHRLFETNWPLLVPPCAHGQQGRSIAVYGDHPQRTDRAPWRAETLQEGQRAMGVEWMPWESLTQAIPPAYCELIGHQLLSFLNAEKAAA